MSTNAKAKSSTHGNEHGPLLTYREAAEYLGVCERTLWGLVNQRSIGVIRFAEKGAVRFSRHELDMWIESRLTESKQRRPADAPRSDRRG